MSPILSLMFLKAIEWEGDRVHYICPFCKAAREAGHMADCELQKAIERAASEAGAS